MLWVGPCLGGGDGSRERYGGGWSENASSKMVSAFSDYHRCEHQSMKRGDSIDVHGRSVHHVFYGVFVESDFGAS